jgi:hypothetical protein
MNWSLLRWLSGGHQEPSGDRREDRRRGYEAGLHVSAAEYRADLLADYVAAQKKTVQTVLSALDEADRMEPTNRPQAVVIEAYKEQLALLMLGQEPTTPEVVAEALPFDESLNVVDESLNGSSPNSTESQPTAPPDSPQPTVQPAEGQASPPPPPEAQAKRGRGRPKGSKTRKETATPGGPNGRH